MSHEGAKWTGILTAVGGAATALLLITYGPRNETGADLSREYAELQLRMNASRSHEVITGYEQRRFEITQNPDYKDFRKENKTQLLVVGGAAVIAGAGVAVAIEASEKKPRFKFPKLPKFPHNLRGHHT